MKKDKTFRGLFSGYVKEISPLLNQVFEDGKLFWNMIEKDLEEKKRPTRCIDCKYYREELCREGTVMVCGYYNREIDHPASRFCVNSLF